MIAVTNLPDESYAGRSIGKSTIIAIKHDRRTGKFRIRATGFRPSRFLRNP